MGRAPCCDKASVKRGPWSPEEDAALKSYVEAHGTGGSWIALPHKAGLRRCGKSCRLRWLNYLRPDIKHGGFTEVEDKIICSLYSEIGSRWSVIASHLPGRTDNDVKNYWNTKLKKKLLTGKLVDCVKNSKNNIILNITPAFLGFTANHLSGLPKIDMYHQEITPSNIYGPVSAEFPAISDATAGMTSTNNVHNLTHYHYTGFNFNSIKSEFGTSSSSHEGSNTSISTNSSSISSASSFLMDNKALPLDCHRGSLEDASVMMDYGFGYGFPGEVANNDGLWFQEKAHENTVMNCSYNIPSSAELNYIC